MIFIQLATYLSILTAFIAMAVKAFRYISAPQHFRWELYPVPHEKGRSDYGGSYLEELDWWSKPRQSDKLNELLEMMSEIFFLKGVLHNNKRVWLSSFPFHLGLYCSIGWLLLLLGGGILQIFDIAISANGGFLGIIVYYATVFFGYFGLILTALGAFGLVLWRAANKRQRVYNSPSDYINLLLFDIVIVIALISQYIYDPYFTILRDYVISLITFSSFSSPGLFFSAEIVLVALLIMYITLTRMSHFVAKFFLYHSVRWNDEPNFKGSKIEANLLKLLEHKVGWSAPHIQTGKKWSEVVKENNNE
ncbi:MAG: hypothetical protein J7K40_01985 [candidate division Zixibacteria bacterium]|nr:hypothetical protein [candidate division Zixibacteria bacterium]